MPEAQLDVILGFKADKGSLKRVFDDVQKTSTAAVAAPGGGGPSGGMGQLVKSFSIAGIALNQLTELGGKILDVMSESSAALKGTFELFAAAFILFFKPFGDFLSTLLRPLAIALIKFAIEFNKFSKTLTPEAMGIALGAVIAGAGFATILGGAVAAAIGALGLVGAIAALTAVLAPLLIVLGGLTVGVSIAKLLGLDKLGADIVKEARRFGENIGLFFSDMEKAIRENPIANLFLGLWDDLNRIIDEAIGALVTGDTAFLEEAMLDLGSNFVARFNTALEELDLKEPLKKLLLGFGKAIDNVIKWFDINFSLTNIENALGGIVSAVTKFGNAVGAFIDRIINFFAGIRVTTIQVKIAEILGRDIFAPIPKFSFPAFQDGGVMARSGLALLEAGERVLRPGEGRGGNTTFAPVFNISATINNDADIRELADRINELAQEDFRRHTSIGTGHLR